MNEDIIISQALKNVLISDIEDYDRLPQYKISHELDCYSAHPIYTNWYPKSYTYLSPLHFISINCILS